MAAAAPLIASVFVVGGPDERHSPSDRLAWLDTDVLRAAWRLRGCCGPHLYEWLEQVAGGAVEDVAQRREGARWDALRGRGHQPMHLRRGRG